MKLLGALLLLCLGSVDASAQVSAVDHSDRALAIEQVIAHLETEYVDPATGSSAAQQLRQELAEGRFDQVDDGEQFATLLTARLQELTGDGHLNVEFVAEGIDASQGGEIEFAAAEMEKYYGAHLNFGVQRTERLEGNIGYLDLRVFAPLDLGAETMIGAMNVIANTDALIIDLRQNGGGVGDMADLVASYLFDDGRHPLTGVYDRPSDTLTQHYTQAYVPGQRFGGSKPVYVLISSRTFSAAEALAYNLQALQRATIVGEVSGGGAHPFEYRPIHPHFVLWSVTAKSINPITGSNWQSVGVQPDIAAPADTALAAALAHLERRR